MQSCVFLNERDPDSGRNSQPVVHEIVGGWCCCPLIPLAVSTDHASGEIVVKHVQKGIEEKSPRWTMLHFGTVNFASALALPLIPLMRHFNFPNNTKLS
jgi:hypothetical protein